MEEEYHFDATPVSTPGSEMLMHENPNRRKKFGLNAKKAWYIAPCFKHYRKFKDILPSTGAERMSDTVRFNHHAISIPQLTPADRILEAARQLDDAIKQQPKRAPVDELTAIELLREVLLGKKKEKLPKKSVQTKESQQKIVAPTKVAAKPAKPTQTVPDEKRKITPFTRSRVQFPDRTLVSPKHEDDDEAMPDLDADFISDGADDEDEDTTRNHRARIRNRVMAQKRKSDNDALHHIKFLAANKTADIPALTVKIRETRGFGGANMHLQLYEWAYEKYFANEIIDEETGKLLEYRDLVKLEKYRDTWNTSLANELWRLVQGIRDVPGTNTILFIPKSDIPKDRWKEATYGQTAVSYIPQKTEKNISRLVLGGYRLVCIFDVSTPTCDLPTIKMLWNYVLSMPGDKFFTLDLANFYLGTTMACAQYMRLPIKIIPQEVIDKYHLNDIVEDGWVYVKIVRGMYGFTEAGKIANNLLKKRLD